MGPAKQNNMEFCQWKNNCRLYMFCWMRLAGRMIKKNMLPSLEILWIRMISRFGGVGGYSVFFHNSFSLISNHCEGLLPCGANQSYCENTKKPTTSPNRLGPSRLGMCENLKGTKAKTTKILLLKLWINFWFKKSLCVYFILKIFVKL